MLGVAVLAGSANVIMQLAVPAVGYGVYESRVDSGNLFRHPVKRTRTTLSYLAVAVNGSAEDRRAYRAAVNRAHAQVYSTAESPVQYTAFDPALQLWVAACLYRGWEDIQRIYGDPATITEDAYRRGAVLGTTLQVPAGMWPATREEFERYWQDTVSGLVIDPVIRDHLMAIARLEFAGPIVARVAGWWSEILTIGFLPVEFRELMGVSLSPRQQRLFDAHNRVVRAALPWLPRLIRLFPFNALLADVRWRMRTSRPLV
ncbi:oxygenase MpaB family protein [Gordonia sinesedis]